MRRRRIVPSDSWRLPAYLASDSSGPRDPSDPNDPFALRCPKCQSTRTHIREVDVLSKLATIICLDCRTISVVPFHL